MHYFESFRTVPMKLASLSALVAAMALLVADSAGPQCKGGKFDRTYDVTSQCNGEYVGRVRISWQSSESNLTTRVHADVQTVSGNVNIVAAELLGSCARDDEPFEVSSLSLKLGKGAGATEQPTVDGGASSNTIGTPSCDIALKTQLDTKIDCPSYGSNCTVQLHEVR